MSIRDGDERLGRRADDLERGAVGESAAHRIGGRPVVGRDAQEVHVRTRIRGAQDAVDVQAGNRARGREALRQHDLEGIAAADVLLRLPDRLAIVGLRGPGLDVPGDREVEPGRGMMPGRCEGVLHPVEPRDGIGPGLVDAGIGVVIVDRVRDEGDRAVGVIEDREIGREEERNIGDAQDIGVVVRDALPVPDRVVAEVADESAGERGKSGQRLGVEGADGVAQDVERGAVTRQVAWNPAEPGRGAIALGEHRRGVHPDERVARPGPPLLGGLQEERPGAIRAQRAEQPDGRVPVREEATVDRDDASIVRERAESSEVRRRHPDRRPGHQASRSGRTGSAAKHVGEPVWQAGPTWSTVSRIVSPSQSTRIA